MSVSAQGGRVAAGRQRLADVTWPDFGAAGIGAQVPVLTMAGVVAAGDIAAGARIVTRHGMQRVLAVTVTEEAQVRVIRLCRDVLGQGRPGEDVLLCPEQPILLRDWRARALYGRDQALVPVARLVDGEFIRAETLARFRAVRLQLDQPAVIYAGGLELGFGAIERVRTG